MSGTKNWFSKHQLSSFKHVSLCIFSQENPSIYFCPLSPSGMVSCRMPGFGSCHLGFRPFHSTPTTLCFWITPSSSSQVFHLGLAELLVPEMCAVPLQTSPSSSSLSPQSLPHSGRDDLGGERWPWRSDRPGGAGTPVVPHRDSGPGEHPEKSVVENML